MRPPRPPSLHRTVARVSGRARNLERRYEPGVTDGPMAQLRTSTGHTVAGDNAQHYISLQHGSGALFDTDAAWTDIFDNSSTTTFTGSPVYGLGVLLPGTYRYEWSASPASGGTAGAVLEVYWASSGTAYLSSLQQGRTKTTVDDTWDRARSGHLFWTEYQSFDVGGAPGVAAPWVKLASGSDITIDIQLIVTRINSKFIAV